VRILVTGGAGYIGSHTAKALARAGHEPITFDDLRTGHRWAVKWGPFLHHDLADGEAIRAALRTHAVEAVIHFAASAYVGDSMRDPRGYFRNNVVNTLNLLDAMVDTGVTTIVFSSSCTTYGPPQRLPIAEDHPQRPANPYGETKLTVERALHWYGQAYGLRWVVLRFFNAAGADLDGEIGEDHDPETHLIPSIIQAALALRPPFEIFGTDYDTPDGTAIRDFVHVADLADAHVRAVAYLAASGDSRALNLGAGVGHSVREVIAAVETAGGCAVPYHTSPRRPGDVPTLIADAGAAHAVLGWSPDHSDLDVIVRSAWDWHCRLATSPRQSP
jgi:UDP-glucose-4-epimerase GalE